MQVDSRYQRPTIAHNIEEIILFLCKGVLVVLVVLLIGVLCIPAVLRGLGLVKEGKKREGNVIMGLVAIDLLVFTISAYLSSIRFL